VVRKVVSLFAASVLDLGLGLQSAAGASVSGQISMRVLKTLAIQAVDQMTFDAAYAGAPASTVNSRSSNSGSFKVTGEPNSAVTINLPKEIVISTGAAGADETIRVHDFTSYPAGSGTLQNDGSMDLTVGATRDALSTMQKDGVYSGSYTVEVIY
jgi:hypothetical protein